jgi:catechol 2,3-dioxygenase
MAKTMEIGEVHINSSNIGDLVAYYRTLGLSSERNGDTIELKAGKRTLVVLHETKASRRHEVGLYHFAIRLPSRRDLGDFVQHLIDRRISVTGASDHRVSEAVYLSDPEGNGIEVYRDREETEWYDDGEIAMTTEAMDLDGVLGERSYGPYQGMPDGTDIGHIHLHVLDLDASEKFYRDSFGIEKMMDVETAILTSRDGYHHHIGMNTWLRGTPKEKEDGRPGLRGYVIRLSDDAFDTLFKDSAEGIKELRDPNNILITVIRGLTSNNI